MAKIQGHRRQYFSLDIMKKISENNIIKSSAFVKEMERLGYISPRTYIWRYERQGILKKIKKGEYKLFIT